MVWLVTLTGKTQLEYFKIRQGEKTIKKQKSRKTAADKQLKSWITVLRKLLMSMTMMVAVVRCHLGLWNPKNVKRIVKNADKKRKIRYGHISNMKSRSSMYMYKNNMSKL